MSIDRQESLRNLGGMVARIRTTGSTGRLALRNTVRMGTLHLYFERGQLVHVVGSHGSIDDALIDLAGWTDGVIRFDADVLPERQAVTPTQQEFFQRTLLMMQQRGALGAAQPPVQPDPFPPLPQRSRSAPETTSARLSSTRPPSRSLPESSMPPADGFFSSNSPNRQGYTLPPVPQPERAGMMPPFSSSTPMASGRTEVLLSARQWELLVEVMRAMLESVGHLFGQQQAQNILQHALVECSEESEVLGLLQVDRQGWLREVRVHEMSMQPVREVAEAFVLLISDFERRCAGLLGEEKARQMIARALYPYHDGLAEIGIALN